MKRYLSIELLVIIIPTLLSAVAFAGFAAILYPRGAVFSRDDPVGYYVYLRSLVHDGDLDFTNDYQFFRRPDGTPVPALDRIDPVTGRPDDNYTVGLPLLIAPFYLVGNLFLAPLYRHGSGAGGFPLFLDQLVFSYGGLVLGFLAMWLSCKFAGCFFPQRDSLVATVAFWLCSPLIYYFAREPFQSHLAAAFAVSLFLYLWEAPSLSAARRALLMGVAAALVLMVREQDIVILLIPLGALVVASKQGTWSWQTVPWPLLLFAIGFTTVFAVQMMAWHSLRGSFLTFAYRGETFAYIARPRIWQVLFSSNHGLIAWHPLIAMCLVGLVLLGRTAGAIGWLALLCFTIELYLTGSWWCWWMGNSFGHRGFLGLTPLFVLGLAAVVARLTRPWARRLFFAVVVLLFVWNVTLMLAYLSEMIPYQGEFSWWAFIQALPRLPSHVFAKLHSI